jgi:M6 family metalloprotease-like protein
MSGIRGKISLIFLLLLVALTAAADDGIRQRGCRRGVVLSTTRSLRAQETPRQVGGDFYHGNRRQLVVLATFRDQAFQDDQATTTAKWDKIFNASDYHEDSFVGSVHDYFYAQSYGNFNLTFDLVYVNLPDSLKKYRSTATHDEYSQYVVDDIVDILSTQNIDWSLYDWNGDGYVNQLLIVYAGKGQNADGDRNTIWPHQWWLSKHLKNPNNQREGYRDYRTVTSGDKQFIIDCYCCVQEEVNYRGTKSSFGTICHEFSHCFGLPDFYYGSGTSTVGSWDLMDFGNYGDAGFRPCGYSAHERWLMGWLTPVELTTATTVSAVPALYDHPQAYIIHNDAHPDECYMVENRQQTGWDASLPGSGLMVFHVDYDASIWPSTTTIPNSSTKKRYRIIPANNKSTSYQSEWGYPYQTNDSLTNTSKPAAELNNANVDGTYFMNKSLYDIKVENGLASFRFTDGPTTGIEELKSGEPYRILYDLGPIYIIRYRNGEIKKVMKH